MIKTCQKNNWGGKRNCAGRKKTCTKKIPYTRRINENILNILKNFALENNMTETEALENAILLQNNIYKSKGDKIMKIVIPSSENKLCSHFGHCDTFTFVEINPENKEILSIENKIPEEGISCAAADWIAELGTNVVLAGGMGMRPLNAFAQKGVKVITGCPEMDIKELVTQYMNSELTTGENSCGGEGHHHCHNHGGCHHNH